MALLEVKNLTKNFGGLTAVGDVTMELNEGELVGLIGPNGAGKTTLFNLLTGVYEPSEGTITLDGHLLNGKAPYKIAAGGLGRTFQNIRLFKDLSVLDNVLIIVVFGGLGSMSGTVVAAIVLGILNMVLQDFSSVRMIIYSLALILVMIFRPGGLLGTWEFSLKKLLSKKEAN